MKRKLLESTKKQVAFEQEYKCNNCKCILPPSYQIDHVIPHSISEDDSRENLVALCPTCHANKTQDEHKRIIYFKKTCAKENKKLCYFCLNELNDKHDCDKTLKPITKKKENYKKISSLYRYAMTDDSELTILNNLNLLDDILRITITREYVHINNFFTKVINEQLTPKDLADIVKEATKCMNRKISIVKIYIIVKNEGGPGGEACVKYFSKHLPNEMPSEIFMKNKFKIEYEYIVNEK